MLQKGSKNGVSHFAVFSALAKRFTVNICHTNSVLTIFYLLDVRLLLHLDGLLGLGGLHVHGDEARGLHTRGRHGGN